MHVRKGLGCLEETMSRNIDIKGDGSEGSERQKNNRENFCRLGGTYVMMTRMLPEM